jgi:transposase
MVFREVTVVQVREVLRNWLRGAGERPAARAVGVDRKTARRYIAAAIEAGLRRDGDESQLSDELVGQVCEAVRPSRPDGHGESWKVLLDEESRIKDFVEAGLTVAKIHDLLGRSSVVVPYRTLVRFCVERLGSGQKTTRTVPVADPPPGRELQVDFGRMGLIACGERRRFVYALIFTACYSRYCYAYLSFHQTIEAVIEGFEEAWAFFGGVFPVVIPDNMAQIVKKADKIAPRFNDTFLEYSQSRGFYVDPARVASPDDKPRVERTVPFVRDSFFAGEKFLGLTDARTAAPIWCRERAGMRIHGTTRLRPAEVFRLEEQPLLLAAPSEPYDVPSWSEPKVHRDFRVQVDKSLYTVHHSLVGQVLLARADQSTVKIYKNGQLVKLHPRMAPGKSSNDPADFPAGTEIYATRDLESLRRRAAECGEAIGAYAKALLEHPLPWTKMRQVYRLLGLVKKWGNERVETACTTALQAEAIDVNLIARMLERAREAAEVEERPAPPNVVQGRFARDPAEFRTNAKGEGK